MCVRLTTGTQLLQLHACPLQYSFNQEQQCIVIHSGSCLGRCMEAEEAARSSATTNKSHSKTIPKAHNALEAQRIAACNDNPTNQHATSVTQQHDAATRRRCLRLAFQAHYNASGAGKIWEGFKLQ